MTNKVWIVWLDGDLIDKVFSDPTSAFDYANKEMEEDDFDPNVDWVEDYDLKWGRIMCKHIYHISCHDVCE
jgi:hypothetical protein